MIGKDFSRRSLGGEKRRWYALVVVCVAMLMNALDATIVNVALPSIKADLGFSEADLTWVVNAYLISFGSFLLLAGRLGDLVGRRRVFLVGVVIFTAASLACGLSQDQTMLVVARFVQGLGGAVATSVIIAIIATEFRDPGEQAKAMGVYIFVAVGGGSIGLLAGGILTEAISWHWIFFINVPIGVATLVLGRAVIDESEAIGLSRSLDVVGSVLVTLAMMVGVYAIVEATGYGWGSLHTLGLGALALALLAAFVVLEARLPNPIMPLRIFRVRGLAISSLVRGFAATGMWASFFFGALYLENVLGYSATETGLAFLPMSLMVAVLSIGTTAKLVARFGARRVLVPGLIASACGLLLLASVDEHTSFFPLLFLAFLVLGAGAGTSFMPLLTIAMRDVPKPDAGLGSGIVNVSMQISAALGLAVLGTLATDRANSLQAEGHSLASALTSGYHLAFLVAAACVVVGIAIALALLPKAAGALAPQQPEQAPE